MTQDYLTRDGEQKVARDGFDGISVDIGVYNDSIDDLSEDPVLADITTEPGNSNYSRSTTTLSLVQTALAWGVDNDSELSFDFSDSSSSDEFDTFFIVYNLDGSDTIIGNPSMADTHTLSSTNILTVAAGNFAILID